MSCGWPFHHDSACDECKQWEQKYGENVDEWLRQKQEIQEAAKAGRRATSRGITRTKKG